MMRMCDCVARGMCLREADGALFVCRSAIVCLTPSSLSCAREGQYLLEGAQDGRGSELLLQSADECDDMGETRGAVSTEAGV
jgi:hypothetical protein